jgi:uncharacterized caspase-like protein
MDKLLAPVPGGQTDEPKPQDIEPDQPDVLLPAAAFAQTEKRIALLIGNQGYPAEVGPLKNPHKDIRLVGAALAKVGFEVLASVQDASHDQILYATHDFADRLRAAGPNAVGFLYYSGHGVAVGGDNFLIPVTG